MSLLKWNKVKPIDIRHVKKIQCGFSYPLSSTNANVIGSSAAARQAKFVWSADVMTLSSDMFFLHQ